MDSEWLQLLRRARRAPLFDALGGEGLERGVIERLLPHRGPALLVEHIAGLDLGALRVEARRRLGAADRAFDGHFPGDPVWPGVLQVELMGQAGLCLGALVRAGGPPAQGAPPPAVRLLRVHDATFVSEARPGDELRVLARVLDDNGATITCAAQCLAAQDRVVSVALFEAVDV